MQERPRESKSGRVGRIAAGITLALIATVGSLAAGAAAASAGTHARTRAAHADATWLAPSPRSVERAGSSNGSRSTAAGPAAGSRSTAVQPSDPALAERVAGWVTRGGEAELNALGRDFKALEADAKAENLAGMGRDCGTLRVDVAAAQAYDPIPDAEAQTAWAAALTQYASGATDCMTGATSRDYTMITKAADEIMAGSNDLDKVTARLNEIAG